MFGSEMLEVAIGLAFIYFLLSLVCSALSEILNSLFGLRYKTLIDGIRVMLNDPQAHKGWIASLDVWGRLLQREDPAQFSATVKLVYDHALIKALEQGKPLPDYIPARVFANAILDHIALKRIDGQDLTIEELINKIDNEKLKEILRSILLGVNRDWNKARENIEIWFDLSMERVTGWYKRRSQWIILLWAILITYALNADTLMIADTLSRDATMRTAIVNVSERVASDSSIDPAKPIDALKKVRDEVEQIHLPLGWPSPDTPVAGPTGMLFKGLGFSITVLALTLGAPFWFDILNKLVNLRLSGRRPEESKATAEAEAKK